MAELLNSCTFAARLPASEVGLPLPLSAFRGQMGCMYLFEDILSPGAPESPSAASRLGIGSVAHSTKCIKRGPCKQHAPSYPNF